MSSVPPSGKPDRAARRKPAGPDRDPAESTDIVLVCTDAARADEARRLSANLCIPLLDHAPGGTIALVLTAGHLELQRSGHPGPGPIRVDFASGPLARRGRRAGPGSELLLRAAGLRGSTRPQVFDATAGLGRDTFLLASMGCTIHAVERNPVIWALLADGLRRAHEDPKTRAIVERIHLSHADARELLPTAAPDVVIVDPMYPPRKKSAAASGEMQLLQAVIGDDPDPSELLELALQVARRRVVVKRPRRAPPLGKRDPTDSIVGRSTRFDLYAGDRLG